MGYGAFMSWQFFVLQFWLELQHVSPLTVALYLTPNAVFGVLATFIVSRIAHVIEGHYIFAASMVAFAMGPVFFLPQKPNTIYWALSMPGIAVTTFGPVSQQSKYSAILNEELISKCARRISPLQLPPSS